MFSLGRVRARARLLAADVTVRQIAERAGVHETLVSHVLAGRRSAASAGGRKVRDAACALSGLTWDQIMAPVPARPLAA
jgi:transcriptional regulator with XRE-family HTH domain